MCGIIGFASHAEIKEIDKYLLGIEFLNHRGPDGSGKWTSADRSVGLAHSRLSIIDLSKNGSQPMTYNDGRFVIVYNGEIYNYLELKRILLKKGYKFNSKTDTEVILAAYSEWGENCPLFFNGMFAFAIYDSIKKTLFLSRDRVGEKPLFYKYKNGVLSFSSELKGLLFSNSSPNKINFDALDCYLSFGFVPGNRCILDGFNKLPAASSLVFDIKRRKIKISKYWQESLNNDYSSDFNQDLLVDELEYLLDKSVKQQLQADVPVGVLLSGGIDSSLITAIACRYQKKIKTFTVRFPGSGNLDETNHARIISKYFDTEHIELEMKPPSIDLFEKLAYQFDEPIVDSSIIPTYAVTNLVKKYCKVALSGDGGDELFGGYDHYSRLEWLSLKSNFFPHSFLKILSYMAINFAPIGMKGRNWLHGLSTDLNVGVPLIASYFDPTYRKKLLQGMNEEWLPVAESIIAFRINKGLNLLDRSMQLDFNLYLTEDLLVKVDRASMMNSLEIRNPFLDKDLMEFAFDKVPSFLKVDSRNKKILLKKLTKKILPAQFDDERKQGFSIPINEWLKKGEFRDFFHDVLLDNQTMFDKSFINMLFKGLDKGRNNGERLFALLMIELWKREYKVSI